MVSHDRMATCLGLVGKETHDLFIPRAQAVRSFVF